MGINTEIFLSEKDRVNATVRPSLDHECSSTQTAPSQVDDDHPGEDDKTNGRDQEQDDHPDEHDHHQQEFRQKGKDHEEDDDESKSSSSSSSSCLQIKLPEFKVEDNDSGDHEDGLKTPTSTDSRIPLIPKCPPAPRKCKPLPLSPTTASKRKATAMPAGASCSQQRIKIDLSKEIFESFFSTLQADENLDEQVKVVRQEK